MQGEWRSDKLKCQSMFLVFIEIQVSEKWNILNVDEIDLFPLKWQLIAGCINEKLF